MKENIITQIKKGQTYTEASHTENFPQNCIAEAIQSFHCQEKTMYPDFYSYN